MSFTPFFQSDNISGYSVRGVRAGESVLGAEKTVAPGTGLARERRLPITGESPKRAEDRKKPNPSACTGLAEHLLPRRHGLIQSFPSFHGAGQQKFNPRFRNVLALLLQRKSIADVQRTEVNALQCKYVSMRVGGAECSSCQKSCVSCVNLHRKRWIPKSSLP